LAQAGGRCPGTASGAPGQPRGSCTGAWASPELRSGRMGTSSGGLKAAPPPYAKSPSGPTGLELDFLNGVASSLSSQLPSFVQNGEECLHYPVPEALTDANYVRTVNVAVTGASGAGKSLFVNNVRGIKHGHPDWAPVGVNETTAEPIPYAFPGEPRVRLWDMQGASTTCTSENTSAIYIRKIGLRYFDIVLLLSCRRFSELEYEVVTELRGHGVPFFFVRTKLDVDIMNNMADNRLDAEETERKIREDLLVSGIAEPYLINVREVGKHDFPQLFRDVIGALACPLHEVVSQREPDDDA